MPLSVLLLLVVLAASHAQVISPTQTQTRVAGDRSDTASPPWDSPCWDVQRRRYYPYESARAECESISGCTYVSNSFAHSRNVVCAPTAFFDAIEPGACSGYALAEQLSYWKYYRKGWSFSHSPDMCKWTNCLKNRIELCPLQVSDWQEPEDRRCAWHNDKCQQSVLTDEWLEEKRDLLGNTARDDALALHRCTADAMWENGLTASRSDFGCGASVLSPDCVAQVTAMGN
eukprot:Rhum_TRINITY_DN15451_c2_g1::Rhum_TRINITY_DN15451_c2_g1_i1::g.160182::m.160182